MSKKRKSTKKEKQEEKQDPVVAELNRCAKWFIGGFFLSIFLPVILVAVTSIGLAGMDWYNTPAAKQAQAPIANTVSTAKADRDSYAEKYYVPPDPRQPAKLGCLPTAAELHNRRTVVVQELDF